MITFIYTLHIAIILFFSTISSLTHTMEITKPLQKKVDLLFVDYNNTTEEYYLNNNNIKKECDLDALRTSNTLKNMFDSFKEIKHKQIIPIQECSAEDFNIIYQGMEQLITNNSNRTKQRLIHTIYAKKTINELMSALFIANKLDIPFLTDILIPRIAQEADNLSHKEQNDLLKRINTHETALAKFILWHMKKRIPILTEAPLTQNDDDNDRDDYNRYIFSPCKKFKIDKQTKDVIHCSSNKILYPGKNRYFFDEKCIFSPQDNYMFYLTDESKENGELINVNNLEEVFKINNIIWRKLCFNNNGKRLLIRTYDQKDISNKQPTGNKYKIIDTSTGQSTKTIENDDQLIKNICFCTTDKLFIQYEKKNNRYSIRLINNDDDKSNKVFNNVTTHAFDETKKTLVLCSQNFNEINVTILDMENLDTPDMENLNTKKITSNLILKNIPIIFNKNNNDFLIHAGTIDDDQVFLYDSEKGCFKHLMSFIGTKDLTLNWSPSGDHIIYKYTNIKQPYENKKTIGYFSINDSQQINLPTDKHAERYINPQQDIIYLLNKEVKSTGSLKIYDLNTRSFINSYESTDFRLIKDTEPLKICDLNTKSFIKPYDSIDFRLISEAFLLTPEKYLSPDGKLLLIPQDKWTLINTKTSTIINEWPRKSYSIFWANEHLIVKKWDTSKYEYVLDKKYSMNYSNFEDNIKLQPSHTENNIELQSHGHAKLGIASIALLIIYYPEFSKKLGFGR